MGGSVADVVLGFNKRHLLLAARQAKLKHAPFHIDGEVDVGIGAVHVRNETQWRRGAEFEPRLDHLLLLGAVSVQRSLRNGVRQVRVAVELRDPQLAIPLASSALVAPRATALQY